MAKWNLRLVAILAILSGSSACQASPVHPKMYQVCLHDALNFESFKQELVTIAKKYGLSVKDISAIIRETIENNKGMPSINGPVVQMQLDGQNGFSILASADGLYGFQVTIGFVEGNDPKTSNPVIESVLERFRSLWRIEPAPPDSGAIPFKDC